MLRICYISPISIHSVRYLDEFRTRGYEVSCIYDSRAWVAPVPRLIPTYALPQLTRRNFPRLYLSNLVNIMRILKHINPDLVHLHAQHQYSPAMILSDIPFLLTSWGVEVLNLPQENILIKYSSRVAATKALKITVDAFCLKDIWVNLGIDESKIEFIPFGVNLNIFNPQADGSALRKDLDIPKDAVVLISTRALHDHHYNVETFVRAIPLILKSCDNVKFIIKGKGPLESGLRSLVQKLGVAEHVRFVGLVPHSQVANYLAAADIYVSTCFVDTTSVSLLEAMACGLAPTVTNIVGNRAWIEDGVNGFLFEPMDPSALAEKARQLIENENLRKRFGEKCHRLVEKKASWKDCVSRMERIYHSIAQAK